MFRKRKAQTESTKIKFTGPELEEYFENRYEYLSEVSTTELEIAKDLENLVNKNIERFEKKAELIITEGNEYERQHTGYFAIAISFIIAGLLNVIPTIDNTLATRVLFSIAILSAISAALVLFLEYINNNRFHNAWQIGNDKVINYISRGNWKNPRELDNMIVKLQEEIPKKSKSWAIYIEIVLVSIALISLGVWAIEVVYNPDLWPWL